MQAEALIEPVAFPQRRRKHWSHLELDVVLRLKAGAHSAWQSQSSKRAAEEHSSRVRPHVTQRK